MSGRRGRPRRQAQPPPSSFPQPESPTARIMRLEQDMQSMKEELSALTAMFTQQFKANTSGTGATTPTPTPTPPPPPPQVPPTVTVPSPPVPQPRDNKDIQRRMDFLEMNPPEFAGVKDPVKAEEWLLNIEKIFQYLGCTDTDRVVMASYMLRGQANFWWRATQTILANSQSNISWDVFLNAFRTKYIPFTAQTKMQIEFLNLVQGNMTVDEYENQFTTLMRYDPETVRDPKRRTEIFLGGLRPRIRDRLLAFRVTDFKDALERAQEIERGLDVTQAQYESRSKGKDKGKRVEASPFEPRRGQPKRQWIDESWARVGKPKTFVDNVDTTRDFGTEFQRCKNCDRPHGGPCHWVTGACFKCGVMGHQIKDCPQMRPTEPQEQSRQIEQQAPQRHVALRRVAATDKGKKSVSQGRVFAIDRETIDTSSETIRDYLQ